MQQHNLTQFVTLLKDRKFPIDGMQFEVISQASDETSGFKGVITMEGEDWFSLSWCKWECFLMLLSDLDWRRMFHYLLPYCFGLHRFDSYEVNSSFAEQLRVIRSIK